MHLRIFKSALSILAFSSISSDAQSKNSPAKVDVSHLIAAGELEVSVWATSPDFYNPTNMDMDAHGRMWVTEGVNYRGYKKRRAEGDRVMVLQDTNGDGRVDKSHVFVQEKFLLSPLGISVFDNKIVVAQPPELIVYTDVDRNLVFDPKIDKREVILTGFNGRNHDHSLHAVIAGPDGKWYLNQGNCGAKFTDKSGKTFRITSSYVGGYNSKDWPANPMENAGQKSDDGYVWVGGFIGRMNPDATNMEIVGHNMRNSYEHTVNSMGEIFQSDNDDPPACRNGFLLEYGSAGFSSADGRYSWEAERRPGQSIPTAHWRQESPGYMPPGDIYGSGSPTGVAFYENGALGEKYRGMYLAADAGRREIMQYFPKVEGANYKMERSVFLKTDDAKEGFMFRPADVEVGADGAIYVCDWYDPRVGGHATNDDSLSGTIYRIAPKGFKPPTLAVDTNTIDGLISLLRSPSDNVRFMGFEGLKKQGPKALPKVEGLLSDTNPWVAVRGIWLLPHLGDAGIKKCEALLKSDKEEFRLVAYKALRRTNPDILAYASQLVNDASNSPRVRREVLSSLRTQPYIAKKDLLINLYKSWNGIDRTYMEALGLAVTSQEKEFWRDLKAIENDDQWSAKFTLMTWRLTSPETLPMLRKRSSDKSLTPEQRRLAIDTIAFTKGKEAPATMLEVYLANGPEKQYAQMWLGMNVDGKRWDGLIDRDLLAEKAGIVKPTAPIAIAHMAAPTKRAVPEISAILKLKGNVQNGKTVAARCATCHEIGDTGVNYGPGLTGWGANRSEEQIIKAVLHPNTDIAHGFEGSIVTMKDGKTIEGLVRSGAERAWHFVNNKNAVAYLVVTTMGGQTQKISWKYIKKVEPMKRTLMLYPEQLGLTDPQDIADLAAYLRQLK